MIDSPSARDDSLVSNASPIPSRASERSGLIEIIRILAGIDIVAFHTGVGFGAGDEYRLGFGIPVFLLISVLGVARHSGARRFGTFARERTLRYGAPFLFWCVVYAVLSTVHSLRHDQSPLDWWDACMLWRGTKFHLWFMPAVLGLTLFTELARTATAKWSPTLVLSAAIALGCLGMLAGAADWIVGSSQCFAPLHWLPAAAFVGFAFGRVLRFEPSRRRSFSLLGIALVVALSGFAISRFYPGDLSLRVAWGTLLAALGFIVPLVSKAWSRRLVALSIGIYLCHPMVLQLGFRFLRDLPPALVIGLVWALSALVAFAMQQTPLARFAGIRAPVRPRTILG